jgi:DNA-binding transcriptional LysR family regulator
VERLRDLAGDGFRPGLAYLGDDVHTVLNLVAAGHGLTLLPASVGRGVPLVAPRLVHRVELLHGALPPGPAAELAAALSA